MSTRHFIRFFDEISNADIAVVGGKNASLGEMYQHLRPHGLHVPFGFATTSEAYRYFLKESALEPLIQTTLSKLDPRDMNALAHTGQTLRQALLNAPMPIALEKEIRAAYRTLCHHYTKEDIDVAIRSSATSEDLPEASFAGQQETFLNICNEEEVVHYVQRCYASLFTDRAISYRHSHGFSHTQIALCVGVQKMVRSDKACSGVMFTIDPDSGSNQLIVINSIWGLGENLVGGTTNPDEFMLFKPTLKNGFCSILKRRLGSKALTMVYDEKGHTHNLATPKTKRERYSLQDDEATILAKAGLLIETYYSQKAGHTTPMDIEWAKDGENKKLYIVQARPETVHSQAMRTPSLILKTYKLKDNQTKHLLLSGTAVGEKIATGITQRINDKSEFEHFQEGHVLVTTNTDPDWEPIMKKASAVITDRGGRTCHAAIVAREIGIPAIVGATDATRLLSTPQPVTVCCDQGVIGEVYEGILDYFIESLDLGTLHQPKTQLLMNVGDPAKAFNLSSLPNNGVGLARMEFIINNAINAHPNALIDLYKGLPIDDEKAIKHLIRYYDDPKEFFINELAKGIGTIVAAFYPKPVILRTSDFKSNEYKHMLGGTRYEPDEENPMIGYRGASRYYSSSYVEAFAWECAALKRVRDEMGLINMIVMLPFVRTPEEGRKVIQIMKDQGLEQGVNGLKIYAMCEIPANVVLADEFLKIFDGYSIGSNDLTQLTLGVDRDSHLVAHVFDERNEAVKRMLLMAIEACKKANKYIGICGQAPSDYPEITQFLIDNHIDSISLNPDSIVKTWKLVCELEKKKG